MLLAGLLRYLSEDFQGTKASRVVKWSTIIDNGRKQNAAVSRQIIL